MATSERVAHFEGGGMVKTAIDELQTNDELDLVIVHDALNNFRKLERWTRHSKNKVGSKPSRRSHQIIHRIQPQLFNTLLDTAYVACANMGLQNPHLKEICNRKGWYMSTHFDSKVGAELPIGVIASLGTISTAEFFADSTIGKTDGLPQLDDLRTKVLQESNDLVIISAHPNPIAHGVRGNDMSRQSLLLAYTVVVNN